MDQVITLVQKVLDLKAQVIPVRTADLIVPDQVILVRATRDRTVGARSKKTAVIKEPWFINRGSFYARVACLFLGARNPAMRDGW